MLKSPCKKSESAAYSTMLPGNESLPNTKRCLMKIRTFRLFCFLVAFVLLVVVIVLSIVLATNKHSETSNQCFQIEFDQSRQNPINTSGLPTGCSNPLHYDVGCNPSSAESWTLRTENTTGWNEVMSLAVDAHVTNFSSILVSPLYSVMTDSCSILVSLHPGFDTRFSLYAYSTKQEFYRINVTSGDCPRGVIENRTAIQRLSTSFRLVAFVDSTIGGNDVISGSVTSHRCVEFETIKSSPATSNSPHFRNLTRGVRDTCSLEYVNREVDCDWMQAVTWDSDRYERIQYHPCLSKGAPSNNDITAVWFLMLRGTKPLSRAYLVSPVIDGRQSRADVSVTYYAQCVQSTIRVYIASSVYDFDRIASGAIAPYVVEALPISIIWSLFFVEMSVFQKYESYQVVIEVEAIEEKNCTWHTCSLDWKNDDGLDTPAIFALDEIFVETKLGRCNNDTTGNTTMVLDCSFENETGSLDSCQWESSTPNNVRPEWRKYFHHWKIDKKANSPYNGHGATNEHFKGRGYIVSYHKNAEGNYFRTPLMTSRRECSCLMSFWYLLRGYFAPRLQVNIVLSNSSLPKLPQWTEFGDYHGGNWTQKNLTLNLPSPDPFLIEFTVLFSPDARSEANIDDIFFIDCDFQMVT